MKPLQLVTALILLSHSTDGIRCYHCEFGCSDPPYEKDCSEEVDGCISMLGRDTEKIYWATCKTHDDHMMCLNANINGKRARCVECHTDLCNYYQENEDGEDYVPSGGNAHTSNAPVILMCAVLLVWLTVRIPYIRL